MIWNYIQEGKQRLAARNIQKIRGTETGNVVQQNREYIDSLQIEMRMIDACSDPDTSFSFLGQQLSTPVMSAALSGLDNIRKNGMRVLAEGMKTAGSCVFVGIGSDSDLRRIVSAGAPTAKIIKPYRDHDRIFGKMEVAEQAGCFAVGMDTSFFFGSQVGDRIIAADMVSPKTKEELAEFVRSTKLPFIAKGILSEKDADKVLEIGVSAIVVSSHSGSVMDYAVPPLRILPRIVKLVNGQIPILVDGDICHGSDVFKAIALGADGVLCGRALMAGMEMDGADGVANVVNGITDELRRIMGQTGANSLRTIDPTVLWMK